MTRTWVDCPICKESDMQCETNDEGQTLIYCVNGGCPSNIIGEPSEEVSDKSLFHLEALAVRERLSSEDWYAKANTQEYRDLQDRCMRLVSCSEFGVLITKNIG